MRKIVFTSQFKRDVKLAERRHKDVGKLLDVFWMLAADEVLPEHYKDHALSGNWKHHRDLHIEPDWLLISPGCNRCGDGSYWNAFGSF